MEIKYERTPVGFIQTRERDGKKYYCLYQIMKGIGIIPSTIRSGDYKHIRIEGEITYARMCFSHNLILTAFIDESGFKKLIGGRHT